MQRVEVDCVIIGGGVAGLWLFNRLRQEGYSSLLFDANPVGSGQTICSQGIIHGGTKYAVKQVLTSVAQAIAAMPNVWRDCLMGKGEIDLSSVEQLAKQQQLWVPGDLLGRFVGFLTSKAMQSRVTRLSIEQYPALLKAPGFKGEVYALDEPVLNVTTLIHALAKHYTQHIYRYSYPNGMVLDRTRALLTLTASNGNRYQVKAKKIILTAGAANEVLLKALGQQEKIRTQRRSLHMLMLKGLPQHFYAHIIDYQFKPQLTITSYQTDSEEIIWYIGGDMAVKGVEQTPEHLFATISQRLQTLLPSIPFTKLAWRTLRIDRAEPWCQQLLPDKPMAIVFGDYIVAWPVKLAFAPLLARTIIQQLQQQRIEPSHAETPLLTDFSFPGYAPLPWHEGGIWN